MVNIINKTTLNVYSNQNFSILSEEKIMLKCEEFLKSNEIYPGTVITKLNEDLTGQIQHIIIDEIDVNLRYFI